MRRAHPPEFRQRAVELARLREKPVAEIARDLGISDSGLRNCMAQADAIDGTRAGLSSDERAELMALRRKNRVLEVEIFKRASAYFARENVRRSRCTAICDPIKPRMLPTIDFVDAW
jgi:transposase